MASVRPSSEIKWICSTGGPLVNRKTPPSNLVFNQSCAENGWSERRRWGMRRRWRLWEAMQTLGIRKGVRGEVCGMEAEESEESDVVQEGKEQEGTGTFTWCTGHSVGLFRLVGWSEGERSGWRTVGELTVSLFRCELSKGIFGIGVWLDLIYSVHQTAARLVAGETQAEIGDFIKGLRPWFGQAPVRCVACYMYNFAESGLASKWWRK